jgi:hypothetical protein
LLSERAWSPGNDELSGAASVWSDKDQGEVAAMGCQIPSVFGIACDMRGRQLRTDLAFGSLI